MARKKNDLINFTQEILGVVAMVGLAAGLVKFLSPDQRCPRCDRVLKVVDTIQNFCPGCNLLVTR